MSRSDSKAVARTKESHFIFTLEEKEMLISTFTRCGIRIQKVSCIATALVSTCSVVADLLALIGRVRRALIDIYARGIVRLQDIAT